MRNEVMEGGVSWGECERQPVMVQTLAILPAVLVSLASWRILWLTFTRLSACNLIPPSSRHGNCLPI